MRPRTRAEILRERAKLGRKIADLDVALAALESDAAPGHIAPSSLATTAEIVDMALENASVRPTRRSA